LLVYPNQRWLKTDLTTTWNQTPYAICLLAAMIRDLVDVKIIDAQFYDLTVEQFQNEIRSFKPDMVGVSLLSSEYGELCSISSRAIKEVNGEIVVIVGGVHVTTLYEQVMKNEDIDYAVRGEGEYVLPALIKHLNGESPYPTEGMIRWQGETLEVLPQAIVEDLNGLPIPAYDLIDYPAYSVTIQRYGVDSPAALPYARFSTSRGCPMGCSFCQVETICGKKLRLRSPEHVIHELTFLQGRYGIKGYHFEDDNAFFYKERSKELLQRMIDLKMNLKWKASGVFLPVLDEETFALMAESGCQYLNIAVESGSERVLRNIIRKPLVDLNEVPAKIALGKKHGIYMAANFIIGSPGETWDEILETIRYAETCGADYVKFFVAIPLAGTEMYRMAKELGCIIGDETKVDQRYSVIKGIDFDPKDIAVLRVYEWDRINFTDPLKRDKTAAMMGISIEALAEIRKETRDNLVF
jgi:anaerobic magnesium-protoporphyrin IX monomethyl ester cyclase